MTPAALLASLRGRGFELSAAGGALAVRPGSALTAADRAAITAHRASLVVSLTVGGGWDAAAAVRRMTDADTLVERLGVSGTLPAVAAAAGRVCRAYAARDDAEYRAAVAGFERAVRAAAGEEGQAPSAPA